VFSKGNYTVFIEQNSIFHWENNDRNHIFIGKKQHAIIFFIGEIAFSFGEKMWISE
jgi:hypothetical protein